MGKMGFLS